MIQAENICFKYHNNYVLKNINFSIDNGEIFGIIGKTGSGKSSLVNILSGLTKPNEGKIIINGKNIYDKKENKNLFSYKISTVFQHPEKQLFNKTIYDDIAFSLKNQNVSESKIKKDITEIAKFLNISSDMLTASPFCLSGGEQRKCALACALVTKPKILILDEPASGLDPYTIEKFISLIKNYHYNEKNTIIFISNSIDKFTYLYDRILVLDNGKTKALDKPEKIIKKSKELGLSESNIGEIISLINQRGYNIPAEISSTKQLQEQILKLIKEKEAKNKHCKT